MWTNVTKASKGAQLPVLSLNGFYSLQKAGNSQVCGPMKYSLKLLSRVSLYHFSDQKESPAYNSSEYIMILFVIHPINSYKTILKVCCISSYYLPHADYIVIYYIGEKTTPYFV